MSEYRLLPYKAEELDAFFSFDKTSKCVSIRRARSGGGADAALNCLKSQFRDWDSKPSKQAGICAIRVGKK